MNAEKPHMALTGSPWFCDQYGHVYGWQDCGNGKKESVILLDGRYSKATTADRMLIATAPELLAALEWSDKIMGAYLDSESDNERSYYWKDLASARETLRVAITKAKGG